MPSVEVIVLGTGAMGMAACAALAGRGARVVGLDRFPVAHDRGSSHGATRLIRQAYFEHPDYVPLLLEAYDLWRDLEEETGRELLERSGLLLAGAPDGEAVAGAQRAANLHALPLERLSAAETRRRFPRFRLADDEIGLWEPAAGYLRVEACVCAFADVAIRRGARLESGVTVLGWREEGAAFAVDTDRGTYRADRLVITPGAWAPDLLRLAGMPFTVLRKTLFWFRPDAPGAADFATGRLPCFAFDSPAGFFYGFPALDASGVKIAEHTGGVVVADPLALDRSLDADELARVAAVARARLPGLGTTFERHAVCMYTMTPDAHFCLGLHPGHPRVAIAAGFSGHGFKFTSVVGETLAELALDGATTRPIGFLAPDRFARGATAVSSPPPPLPENGP